MEELVLFSLVGAAIWTALYWLDVRARRRKAAKTGEKPGLLPVRLFWSISGVAGQLMFWQTVTFFKEWGGMN